MSTGNRPSSLLDLRHLRRETRTALELAIVELAPNDLIDSLAVAAGLLEALVALPPDSAPALALGPSTVDRARKALAAWHAWIGRRKKRA
jgi:hypothetical protein